ncbi:uncharacterized protein RJT20DRAFT_130555 [Scheffersomyces xylosifermentans]|uniref:uncharacterized protein n=1 Tax=Scheffersomyces xylosifermentans TaxID=1304137 RepID=UPI00315DC25E
MLARSSRNCGRIVFKRFQHAAAAAEPAAAKPAFNNKYNFNINPPPVHEYWNYRNASVLLAVIPVYLAVGYVAKYLGSNLEGYEGLIEFAESDKVKDIQFGQPQQFKPTK